MLRRLALIERTVVATTCWLWLAPLTVAAQPVDVMLVLEATIGTEQAIDLIRPKVLETGDRAGVVTFSDRTAQTSQPLTEDREELASALERAGIRMGGSFGSIQINNMRSVNISAAVKKGCEALRREGSNEERARAIILFFGSDDPDLGRRIEETKAALGGARARLYAIVIDRGAYLRGGPTRNTRPRRLPPYPTATVRILSDLAEQSGGQMYPRAWEFKEILDHTRKP